MTDGYITHVDIEREYAVALSNDKSHKTIVHKAVFDKCGQPFRASTLPQAVQFEVGSVLRIDGETGVTHGIASEVKLAGA